MSRPEWIVAHGDPFSDVANVCLDPETSLDCSLNSPAIVSWNRRGPKTTVREDPLSGERRTVTGFIFRPAGIHGARLPAHVAFTRKGRALGSNSDGPPPVLHVGPEVSSSGPFPSSALYRRCG